MFGVLEGDAWSEMAAIVLSGLRDRDRLYFSYLSEVRKIDEFSVKTAVSNYKPSTAELDSKVYVQGFVTYVRASLLGEGDSRVSQKMALASFRELSVDTAELTTSAMYVLEDFLDIKSDSGSYLRELTVYAGDDEASMKRALELLPWCARLKGLESFTISLESLNEDQNLEDLTALLTNNPSLTNLHCQTLLLCIHP
jgi:hypothetical protein